MRFADQLRKNTPNAQEMKDQQINEEIQVILDDFRGGCKQAASYGKHSYEKQARDRWGDGLSFGDPSRPRYTVAYGQKMCEVLRAELEKDGFSSLDVSLKPLYAQSREKTWLLEITYFKKTFSHYVLVLSASW